MERVWTLGLGFRSSLGREPFQLLDGLLRADSAPLPYEPFVRAGLRYPVAFPVLDDDRDLVVSPPWRDRSSLLAWGAVVDSLKDAFGADWTSKLIETGERRVGLVVGSSAAGIGPFSESLASGRTNDAAIYGACAQDLARALGIRGPVWTCCSVCASGAIAIAEASDMLISHDVDVAIAVGVDALHPFVGAGFDALGALAKVPEPFGKDRKGLVLGEGACSLVLAREPGYRSWGAVSGWGLSSDAHHLTAPDPTGAGLGRAIGAALRIAKIDAEMVEVINAHGTATVLNDAMEVAAIRSVFAEAPHKIPVYTVKGTIGHTLGAAGAIEAAISFVAMRQCKIPPVGGTTQLDENCDVDVVVGKARDSKASLTLSLSAGFGGANCALLLERPKGVVLR